MGRKSTLTPEVHAQLCKLVNAGASLPAACESVGVSWNTAKEWLARGKRSAREPFATFAADVKKAQEAWKVGGELTITKAGKKDYRALTWLMERRFREYAPPRHNVDVELKMDAWLKIILQRVRLRAVKKEFKHLTVDAVDELLSTLASK